MLTTTEDEGNSELRALYFVKKEKNMAWHAKLELQQQNVICITCII